MILPIYVVLAPGADRPYVSTSSPSALVRATPGLQVWLVEANLPVFQIVDGKIKVNADPDPLPL